MKNWIKSIFFECFKEVVKNQPLIIANRPPNPEDVYEKGTMWKDGNELYTAIKVTVVWQKHE